MRGRIRRCDYSSLTWLFVLPFCPLPLDLLLSDQNSFYSCCPAPYPTIVFEFTVQRQYSTYITSIIIPLIFATFVAFTTLLMPAPLSGARPGLNVSIMFTCAAIYFVAGNKLPDISDMTLIARLYVACLSVNFILTLTSVLSTG